MIYIITVIWVANEITLTKTKQIIPISQLYKENGKTKKKETTVKPALSEPAFKGHPSLSGPENSLLLYSKCDLC